MKSPRKKLSLTPVAKAAALAGGALAAAQSADAAIVAAVNTPISPPGSPGTNNWDVDGDGTPDFSLLHGVFPVASLTELSAARFVAPGAIPSDGFAKLSAGFVVGPTIPNTNATVSGFKFFTSAQSTITMTANGTAIGVEASIAGWTLGDTGYFGFKFTNVSGTHYGWGEVNIDGDPQGSGFTFLQAYYDDTADAPITVGAIPEPSHVGLLALGAAGLAAWRRRRRVPTTDSHG